MAKKIKKAQLEKVNEQQSRLKDHLIQIGGLESQKHALLQKIATVNEEIEETKKELEKEYGAVNIDLTDGTVTPIEPQE